ncbi:Ankyrin-1 [Fusarium oxysporum f. sp. cubense race 1]|uniref:Ankyrin-1 n=1 Tax=Fusarium oxysporum f. sp. cubense (strain race 1) TaxID=1229664 RepID=N4U6J7_FUSC1|nr:Ankyrin-1 [Fusarium oxysporum f. sp. cubense race 1]
MRDQANDIDHEGVDWDYRVYLVGFPEVEAEETTVPVTEMVANVVPEGFVSQHNIFLPASAPHNGDDKGGSIDLCAGMDWHSRHSTDASAAAYDDASNGSFSPSWIQDQALYLLDRIQQRSPADDQNCKTRVLLSGFGFGGIIVKQAMIYANTIPRYYDLAIDITGLVFFVTPHRSTSEFAWEEVLLSMIRDTNIPYEGRLSTTLSVLVDYVSELSRTFYQFVPKYSAANFIRSRVDSDGGKDVNLFGNDNEKVVYWCRSSYNRMALCTVDDMSELEALRTNFVPHHLLCCPNEGALMDIGYSNARRTDIKHVYFDILQAISRSSWLFYETRILDKPLDHDALMEIYKPIIQDMTFPKVRGATMQVTGPSNIGKSSLIKLMSQHISQQSQVIVIENIMDLNRKTPWDVWTEEMMWSVLSSMLQHPTEIDYLLVVLNFDMWPESVQTWWYKVFGLISRCEKSNCTLLISCLAPIKAQSNGYVYHIDPTTTCIGDRAALTKTKTTHLLVSHGYDQTPLWQNFGSNIRDKVIDSVSRYEGSNSSIEVYLRHMFTTFSISSLEAIEENIAKAPTSETKLYENCRSTLKAMPTRSLGWAQNTIAWMLAAVRPLRIEELAIAGAMDKNYKALAKVQRGVPLDMHRDLGNHFSGLVVIENRKPRIINSLARQILSELLAIDLHSFVTLSCLYYLRLVLGDQRSSVAALEESDLRRRHWEQNHQETGQELLDYACRFWPTHFRLAGDTDESLTTEVIRFLGDVRVRERWFELYLRSDDTSLGIRLGESRLGDNITLTAINDFDAPVGLEGENDKHRIAQIAAYVGLESIVESCRREGPPTANINLMRLQHGYGMHDRLILETPSTYYLDCVIANKDETFAKVFCSQMKEQGLQLFPLHRAALMGRLSMVQAFVDWFDPSICTNEYGHTPLHMAAIGGNPAVIELLVQAMKNKCADNSVSKIVNAQDYQQQTPLVIATRLGNVDAAATLVNLGADVSIADHTGSTAMHYAVIEFAQLVEIFTKQEAAIGIVNHNSLSPLHIAAKVGNIRSVEVILDRLEIQDSPFPKGDASSMTPLQYAAENGHAAIVGMLVDASYSPWNEDCEEGQAPVQLAARGGHLKALESMVGENLEPEDQLGGQLLVEAASCGQLPMVLYLLSQGVLPDSKGMKGDTPLSEASSNGHNAVVWTLLKANADINIQDVDRRTALHHAARHGRYDVLRTLIAHRGPQDIKASVDAPDSLRYTPLHNAAEGGHLLVTELLLKNESSVRSRSHLWETPLHLAIRTPEVVKALLHFKADVHACDDNERTALHLAVIKSSLETVKVLTKAGADIHAHDSENNTPITCAISNNSLELLKGLYNDDLQCQLRDLATWENLQRAIENSALDVLKFLIDGFQDVTTTTDSSGRTLLHIAAEYSSVDVVTFLLDYGFSINTPGRCKFTPLHEATKSGQLESIKRLLENGAEVDQGDEDGETPLYVAASTGNIEAISILLDAQADMEVANDNGWTPLFVATWERAPQAVHKLLDAGAKFRVTSSDGWTVLHACADHFETMNLLLEKVVDPNVRRPDGMTPLHLASSWGFPDIVETLLKHGADPNLVDESGLSALHLAAANGHGPVVQVIVSHGKFNINLIDTDGQAAIHLAVSNNKIEIVQVLIDAGANLTIQTKDGLSCLPLAVHEDTVEILAILLQTETSPEKWELHDLVSAYWKAIELNVVKTAKAIELLKQKHGTILNESRDGFNALETILREAYEGSGPAAAKLVNLGINPFYRNERTQESAFEMAIFSRKYLQDFFEACHSFLQESPGTLDNFGFRELRVIAELDHNNLWLQCDPVRNRISSKEVDHDGWSLDHLYYQSHQRLGSPSQWNKEIVKNQTEIPRTLLMPERWYTSEARTSERRPIELGGLESIFEPSRLDASHDNASIRADSPFPPRHFGQAYFEIGIREYMTEDSEPTQSIDGEKEDTIVSIGFAGEFSDLTNAHPGWYIWSVGYHGDDGAIYDDYEKSFTTKEQTERTFGIGDNVGCGIDYDSGEYFFTLNGEIVSKQLSTVIFRKLYPCIGYSGGLCRVKVNFGNEDFLWPGAKRIQQNTERLGLKRISTWRVRSRERTAGT